MELLLKSVPKPEEEKLWEGIVKTDDLMICDIFCIEIQKVKCFLQRLMSLHCYYEFHKNQDYISG